MATKRSPFFITPFITELIYSFLHRLLKLSLGT